MLGRNSGYIGVSYDQVPKIINVCVCRMLFQNDDMTTHIMSYLTSRDTLRLAAVNHNAHSMVYTQPVNNGHMELLLHIFLTPHNVIHVTPEDMKQYQLCQIPIELRRKYHMTGDDTLLLYQHPQCNAIMKVSNYVLLSQLCTLFCNVTYSHWVQNVVEMIRILQEIVLVDGLWEDFLQHRPSYDHSKFFHIDRTAMSFINILDGWKLYRPLSRHNALIGGSAYHIIRGKYNQCIDKLRHFGCPHGNVIYVKMGEHEPHHRGQLYLMVDPDPIVHETMCTLACTQRELDKWCVVLQHMETQAYELSVLRKRVLSLQSHRARLNVTIKNKETCIMNLQHTVQRWQSRVGHVLDAIGNRHRKPTCA